MLFRKHLVFYDNKSGTAYVSKAGKDAALSLKENELKVIGLKIGFTEEGGQGSMHLKYIGKGLKGFRSHVFRQYLKVLFGDRFKRFDEATKVVSASNLTQEEKYSVTDYFPEVIFLELIEDTKIDTKTNV